MRYGTVRTGTEPDTEFVSLFSVTRQPAETDGHSTGNVDLFLGLGPGRGSPFRGLGGMEREKAGVRVGSEVAGHSLWSQEGLWTKTPGGQVASLSRVSECNAEKVFSATQKNFRVTGPFQFMDQDHLQGFVFAQVHGVSQAPFSPALLTLPRALVQSASTRSLWLLHTWPCMDRSLRKPAMGPVSSPSGRRHVSTAMSPAPRPRAGTLCPSEAGLLILAVCARAHPFVFSGLPFVPLRPLIPFHT